MNTLKNTLSDLAAPFVTIMAVIQTMRYYSDKDLRRQADLTIALVTAAPLHPYVTYAIMASYLDVTADDLQARTEGLSDLGQMQQHIRALRDVVRVHRIICHDTIVDSL